MVEKQQIKKQKEAVNYSELKEKISEKQVISEEVLEEMVKDKEKIFNDTIKLARLFLNCLDILDIHSSILYVEGDPVSKEIDFVKETIDIPKLRKHLEEFGNGHEICSYYTSQEIKSIINNNRDSAIGLVNFFFGIFGEED